MNAIIRQGFTLVELLVTVAVIGILLGLAVPAVQAVRESARKTTCSNNLKQISLAIAQHENSQGFFPSGGWGYTWVGDPLYGFGKEQPGGWVFNTLPFIESQDLWAMARGKRGDDRLASLAQMCATPIPSWHCPTRSQPELSGYRSDNPPVNALLSVNVFKSDYSISAGDVDAGIGPGPTSYAERKSYDWPDNRSFSGVSFLRSAISPSRVTDGLSKTYLVGEKRVTTNIYDIGNDASALSGFDYDTSRWTSLSAAPGKDEQKNHWPQSFGSAHSAGFFVSTTDGAVQLITFDIDPRIHRAFGNRMDN